MGNRASGACEQREKPALIFPCWRAAGRAHLWEGSRYLWNPGHLGSSLVALRAGQQARGGKISSQETAWPLSSWSGSVLNVCPSTWLSDVPSPWYTSKSPERPAETQLDVPAAQHLGWIRGCLVGNRPREGQGIRVFVPQNRQHSPLTLPATWALSSPPGARNAPFGSVFPRELSAGRSEQVPGRSSPTAQLQPVEM